MSSTRSVIQSKLRRQRQAKELHSKLLALNPFDCAELDGQSLRLVGQQYTDAHITAAENLPIAHNGAALQRQIDQDSFADEGSPAENDRIVEREPMIRPENTEVAPSQPP